MYPSCHTEPSPPIAASVFDRSPCSQYTRDSESDLERALSLDRSGHRQLSSCVRPRLHTNARCNGTSSRSFCLSIDICLPFQVLDAAMCPRLGRRAINSTVLLSLRRSTTIPQQNSRLLNRNAPPRVPSIHPSWQQPRPALTDSSHACAPGAFHRTGQLSTRRDTTCLWSLCRTRRRVLSRNGTPFSRGYFGGSISLAHTVYLRRWRDARTVLPRGGYAFLTYTRATRSVLGNFKAERGLTSL